MSGGAAGCGGEPDRQRLQPEHEVAAPLPAGCVGIGEVDVGQPVEQLGATAAQVGLAWLLRRADNILLIPGTSSLAHLEENLAVREVVLSDADLAALDDR